MSFPDLQLSRFDRAVLLTLVGLALLIGLLAWRGDRVGVRVVTVSPPEGATGVSTRAQVRVTFSQEMASPSGRALYLSPAVEGMLRWEGKTTLAFLPATPLTPETTYTVTLAPDLKSRQGRPLLHPLAWQFHTGRLRILYLAPDGQNHDQIFVTALEGGKPLPLTREPFGVWDYTLSPDGMTIVYAAPRQDGGNDLWLVGTDGGERHSILTCPEADCTGAAWSPEGQRLVYERRNIASADSPRLWWLDLPTGGTAPVFQDDQLLGFGARWSPDGEWLSYVSPRDQGVQVYNVNDGRSFLIPSQMEEPASWRPQGDALLVTDIQFQGERFSVHLMRADLESGRLLNLSGEGEVDDGSPAWSPDGTWVAFGRKAPHASMGRQLWLMRLDGNQAHYLTDEPEIHYGPPIWSPDGRYLLFQRYPLNELEVEPGIWLLEVETLNLQQIVTPGRQPTWLP